MTEKLLLEIIIALLIGLGTILWWLFARHDRMHVSLDEKLDELSQIRVTCANAFASKDSLSRAHSRIDEQQAELGELSVRVTRLETREGVSRGRAD